MGREGWLTGMVQKPGIKGILATSAASLSALVLALMAGHASAQNGSQNSSQNSAPDNAQNVALDHASANNDAVEFRPLSEILKDDVALAPRADHVPPVPQKIVQPAAKQESARPAAAAAHGDTPVTSGPAPKSQVTSGAKPRAEFLEVQDEYGVFDYDDRAMATGFYRPTDEELFALIPPAVNTTTDWNIYKTEWYPSDEAGYAAFVTLIGRSSCNSMDDCLRNPANPYRDLEDDTIYLGDCADMAYFLRGYYAWKNGLPFSYQHLLRTASGEPEDFRYSKQGNIVTGRRDAVTQVAGRPLNAINYLQRIGGEVSTAMFRTHPVSGASGTFDDFYPVAIQREHIPAGSIAYDVFGHVGLVFEIEENGRVMIVASHPDLLVTRSTYGANFMRTGPDFGGGLKAWRPIKLVGARKQADGSYVGGRIHAVPNEKLAGFSMEQYFGSDPHPSGKWELAEFRASDRMMGYYDFVRKRLAAPGFAFDPLEETKNALQGVCNDLQDRRIAIELATRSKFFLKPHPGKLPPNIYGTYGDWELYSTPSRDARLKTSFVELRRLVQDQVERHRQGASDIAYYGDNLALDLLGVFDEYKTTCKVRYKRSDGTFVKLNLGHILPRVFDMSFDPYHCPEMRWGASGVELSTCVSTPEKDAWYEAERFLRYQVDRTYDIRMDFRLSEMKSPADAPVTRGGLGVPHPPDIDVKAYLLDQISGGIVYASYEDPDLFNPITLQRGIGHTYAAFGGQKSPLIFAAAGRKPAPAPSLLYLKPSAISHVNNKTWPVVEMMTLFED